MMWWWVKMNIQEQAGIVFLVLPLFKQMVRNFILIFLGIVLIPIIFDIHKIVGSVKARIALILSSDWSLVTPSRWWNNTERVFSTYPCQLFAYLKKDLSFFKLNIPQAINQFSWLLTWLFFSWKPFEVLSLEVAIKLYVLSDQKSNFPWCIFCISVSRKGWFFKSFSQLFNHIDSCSICYLEFSSMFHSTMLKLLSEIYCAMFRKY